MDQQSLLNPPMNVLYNPSSWDLEPRGEPATFINAFLHGSLLGAWLAEVRWQVSLLLAR